MIEKITKDILEMYPRLGLRAIAKELGISHYLVEKVLKLNGIKRIRNKGTNRISINSKYFNTIDSEKKAYFLGLLMADGSISAKQNYLSITLKQEDDYLLQELLNDIHPLGTIKTHKNNKNKYYSNIIVSSEELKSDLEKLGITSNKTFNTKFPDIKKEYYSHFIRGYFDGDGCIHLREGKFANVSMIGTIEILESIQYELCNKLGFIKHKFQDTFKKGHNIRTYAFGGTLNCYKFYNYLYKDATVFMKRKKEKFETAFDLSVNSYNYKNEAT